VIRSAPLQQRSAAGLVGADAHSSAVVVPAATSLARARSGGLSDMAEAERTRSLKRANEGHIAAIKRGTKLGRKSKLDDRQQQEASNRPKPGESL
jgi:hypothetical protein